MAAGAFAQAPWTAQNSGTTQDLWGVCPWNNGFIAVGTGGTILTSVGGATWTAQNSGTTNWLVAVAATKNGYVAVGDQGIILTSPDGITWTQRASGGERLNGVAGGIEADGTYLTIAVGENGAVMTSTDGVTWTAANSGVTGWLRGIVFYGPQFVITGEAGTVLITTDGLSFNVGTITSADLESIAVGARLPGGQSGALLLAGSDGYVAGATAVVGALIAFQPQSGVSAATHYRGAALYNGEAVAAGSGGTLSVSYFVPNPVASGPYFQTWINVATGAPGDFYNAAWGSGSNPLAVAVGQSGQIYTLPWQQGPPSLVGGGGGVVGPATPAFGSTVQLTAEASGGQAPLTYQWEFNGQAIAGATGSTLNLSDVGAAQNGTYSVVVGNQFGSVTGSYTLNAKQQGSIPGLVDESFAPPAGAFPPNGLFPGASAVAVQADGKLVVGGQSLQRYNPDGSPDTAFDAATSAADVNFLEGFGGGFGSVLVQSDGKLLVSGSGTSGGTAKVPYVASWRLNPDGSVDNTYTPVMTNGAFNEPTETDVPQLQLTNGDYLTVVNGATGNLPQIVRLTANGALDSSWTAYTPAGAPAGQGSVVAGANGAVLFVDSAPASSAPQSSATVTYVARLNPDGTFAPTFAPATLAGSGQVFAQPSGAVVYVLGNFQGNFDGEGWYVVGRLTPAGATDASYAGLIFPYSGVDSQAEWTVGPSIMTADGSLYLDLDPVNNGKLPLLNGTYRDGIIRIDPNGNFDPSFSLNVDLEGTTTGTGLLGLASAPGGQWIAWGYFTSFNGEPHADIVRINPSVGANFAGLVNLSARAAAGQGQQTLAVGFVTTGSGNTGMLLRGIGPALIPFGVTGTLIDPQVTLYDGSGNVVATDNNWQDNGQGPAIAAAEQAVGAFALPNGSLDAALLASVPSGNHSIVVDGADGGSGNAMAEAYDTDSLPLTSTGNRAINFSFRAPTGTGGAILTAGFVVAGGNTRRVLIRAVGPSLTSYGVVNPVPDPQIAVFQGSTQIGSAGAWSNDSTLAQTFTSVGAFALPNTADSAVVMTLAPGDYTVEATSKSGAPGVALVEVYEVP